MHQYVRLTIVLSVVAILGAFMDFRLMHAGDWMPAVPKDIDVWTAKDKQLAADELATLGNPRYVARDYTNPAGETVGISVLAASSMNTYHDPRSCSVGEGYKLTAEKIMPVDGLGGKGPDIRGMVLRNGDFRSLLFYWLQNSDGTVDTEGAIRHDIMARLASVKTIFSTVATGRRTCVIRVFTSVAPGDENGVHARGNLEHIATAVYEALKAGDRGRQ